MSTELRLNRERKRIRVRLQKTCTSFHINCAHVESRAPTAQLQARMTHDLTDLTCPSNCGQHPKQHCLTVEGESPASSLSPAASILKGHLQSHKAHSTNKRDQRDLSSSLEHTRCEIRKKEFLSSCTLSSNFHSQCDNLTHHELLNSTVTKLGI